MFNHTACLKKVTERGQERHPPFQLRAETLQEIAMVNIYICDLFMNVSAHFMVENINLNFINGDNLFKHTWKESTLWQSSMTLSLAAF